MKTSMGVVLFGHTLVLIAWLDDLTDPTASKAQPETAQSKLLHTCRRLLRLDNRSNAVVERSNATVGSANFEQSKPSQMGSAAYFNAKSPRVQSESSYRRR